MTDRLVAWYASINIVGSLVNIQEIEQKQHNAPSSVNTVKLWSDY